MRGEGEAFGTQAAVYCCARASAIRFFGTDLADLRRGAGARRRRVRSLGRRARAVRTSVRQARVTCRPETIGYADLDAHGTWRTVSQPTDPCGSRRAWSRTGRRIATATGAGSTHGAGRGSTTRRGASRRSITAAGLTSTIATGHGCRGRATFAPVYAPALVAFVGGGNFLSPCRRGRGVAWFPLAPGEVYRPAYNASRDYFTRVNVTNTVVNVTNVTNVYNNPRTDVRYVNVNNVNAVTAVPAQAFVQAQPVQRAAVRIDRDGAAAQRRSSPPRLSRPRSASVTGAAPPRAARDLTQRVMERKVVAKQAPPPAPPSIERRQEAMKQQPGKPLDRAEVAKGAPPRPTSPSCRRRRAATDTSRAIGRARPRDANANAPEQAPPAAQPRNAAVAQPVPDAVAAPAGRRGRGNASARTARKHPQPAAKAPEPAATERRSAPAGAAAGTTAATSRNLSQAANAVAAMRHADNPSTAACRKGAGTSATEVLAAPPPAVQQAAHHRRKPPRRCRPANADAAMHHAGSPKIPQPAAKAPEPPLRRRRRPRPNRHRRMLRRKTAGTRNRDDDRRTARTARQGTRLSAARHCALMPAAFTTLAESSISSRMNLRNSAGVITIGSAPSAASRSRTSALASARGDVRVDLVDDVVRRARGREHADPQVVVEARAARLRQSSARSAARSSASPSTRRARPACLRECCGSAAEIGEKKYVTRPVIVSVSASGVPLYGMCTTSMPAASLNFSPLMCVPLPVPAEPKLSVPGLFFAAAMRSARLL